jgi:hypothetical protein
MVAQKNLYVYNLQKEVSKRSVGPVHLQYKHFLLKKGERSQN